MLAVKTKYMLVLEDNKVMDKQNKLFITTLNQATKCYFAINVRSMSCAVRKVADWTVFIHFYGFSLYFICSIVLMQNVTPVIFI